MNHDPTSHDQPARWHLWQRVAFRFLFLYLLLFLFPFPVDLIPGLDGAAELWLRPWRTIAPWIGTHLLGLVSVPSVPSPTSGDTAVEYIRHLSLLVIAAGGAAAWSLIQRRKTGYPELHALLRVYLRYALMMALFEYGFAKVVPNQFAEVSAVRLLRPFGDSSPMGLLWGFMGASVPYQVFGGLLEVTAGILLFIRRTATVGALLAAMVLSNVVVLNFAYDVPVKLYSSHLLFIALLIAAPGMRQLLDLFVWNRAVLPRDERLPGRLFRGWWRLAGKVAVALVAGAILWEEVDFYRSRVAARTMPFRGAWEVEGFSLGRTPTAVPDSLRWRRLIFSGPRRAVVWLATDSLQWRALELDTLRRSLRLVPYGAERQLDATAAAELQWSDSGGSHYFVGQTGGDSVQFRLRPIPLERSRLLSRGFHWIQESAYSR